MAVSAEDIKILVKRRDDVELSLQMLFEILRENKTNMTDPLVDKEGFPRSDLDVYTVRKTRHDIICMQNDLRALTTDIEKSLIELHAINRNSGQTSGGSTVGASRTMVDHSNNKPSIPVECHRTTNAVFLRIDDVSTDSPAFQSGLLNGDQVIQFGSIHADNYRDMQQISDVVKDSQNNFVKLTLLRDSKPVYLNLAPKKWTGQGLIGCRIVPLKR